MQRSNEKQSLDGWVTFGENEYTRLLIVNIRARKSVYALFAHYIFLIARCNLVSQSEQWSYFVL